MSIHIADLKEPRPFGKVFEAPVPHGAVFDTPVPHGTVFVIPVQHAAVFGIPVQHAAVFGITSGKVPSTEVQPGSSKAAVPWSFAESFSSSSEP